MFFYFFHKSDLFYHLVLDCLSSFLCILMFCKMSVEVMEHRRSCKSLSIHV